MENRRSGRTTRIIDDAIQDLFHTGECHVWDHYKDGKDAQRNKEVFMLVLRRLQNEHKLIMKAISVDVGKKIITWDGYKQD